MPATVDDSLAATIAGGSAALAGGRPGDAVGLYRRAQALLGEHLLHARPDRFYEDESAAIHRGLAEAYLELGDAHAARIEAERGVNLIESDARLWTALGLARYRTADVDGAVQALGRALALDPDADEAEWGLALAALARNRLAEARRRAERALRLEPRPRYARDLARWSALDGEWRAAADALGQLAGLTGGPAAEATRELRGFYEALAGAPVQRIDRPVVRAQVAFELVPGDEVPYVPVRFDGAAPVHVLLDTGAAWNVIDRQFARSIGVERIWPGDPLHGALGTSEGGYAIVPRIEIGSLAIERVPFAVGDFSALRLDGGGTHTVAAVLNPALLFRDHTVILDYRHGRLEIHRYEPGTPGYAGRQTRQRKAATPFLLDANGVWPVVSVRLDGGRELPFVLDTGASDVLVDRATAAALRVDPRGLVAEAGGHVVQGLRVLLLERAPGDPSGIEVRGILGFPFFRGKRVAFDYREMVLVLED